MSKSKSSTKGVDIFGFGGFGATFKEAREDAMRKIGVALGADYSPVIVQWQGMTTVLWQTPWGICSRTIGSADVATDKLEPTCQHWAGSTMEVERQRACLNLAQGSCFFGTDLLPAILAHCEPWVQSDYWSWVSWQRAYRAAPTELSANDKHRWASDHAKQFRYLSQEVAA